MAVVVVDVFQAIEIHDENALERFCAVLPIGEIEVERVAVLERSKVIGIRKILEGRVRYPAEEEACDNDGGQAEDDADERCADSYHLKSTVLRIGIELDPDCTDNLAVLMDGVVGNEDVAPTRIFDVGRINPLVRERPFELGHDFTFDLVAWVAEIVAVARQPVDNVDEAAVIGLFRGVEVADSR